MLFDPAAAQSAAVCVCTAAQDRARQAYA
jgi:hypothetical protein